MSMKNETRIILTAFRNFLDREEIKNKMLTAVMPDDARLGDLSGKAVDVPLGSVLQGFMHKTDFKKMAKVLDDNNSVVCVFLEELLHELQDYVPPIEDAGVSVENKEKGVKELSQDLKKGDSVENK